MIAGSTTGEDLSLYGDDLEQVDKLLGQGNYEEGISLLQKVARASGSNELMQRLIDTRVDAFSTLTEKINPEPMYEANHLLGDPDAVQARMASDGYLFFRSIVPAERLMELRDQITGILAELGWIADSDERMKARAICRPRREGQPKFLQAHDRIMKLEALHSLSHEPQLMDVMRQVLGQTAFPHPLSIVRLVFPDSPELSTPPHQDYPNNQGTANLTAAWIPLGDCPMERGSLAVMEGSHKFGVLPLKFHLGAGNRRAVLSDEVMKCRWVSADFKAGDILLFPALTVHKAMENDNTELMRLSADFRYQLEGEALTAGCLKPHFERLSWEDIYQGWASDEFKYYWRDKDFVEVPWNEALHKLPEDHADEAYEQELAFNIALTRRQEERAARGGE